MDLNWKQSREPRMSQLRSSATSYVSDVCTTTVHQGVAPRKRLSTFSFALRHDDGAGGCQCSSLGRKVMAVFSHTQKPSRSSLRAAEKGVVPAPLLPGERNCTRPIVLLPPVRSKIPVAHRPALSLTLTRITAALPLPHPSAVAWGSGRARGGAGVTGMSVDRSGSEIGGPSCG